MRWSRFALALMASALSFTTCSQLLAQPPGGGGQRGGGMRGMMGMGGGMMGGPTALIRMPEVQQELKLSDEQKASVNEEIEKITAKTQEIFPRFGGGPGGAGGGQPPGGRPGQGGGGPGGGAFGDPARMQENMKKLAELNKEFEAKLESLLDPDQQDRLVGLTLQRSGVRAINASHMVSVALEVSDDQKASLAKVEEESAAEFREAMGGFGGFGRRQGGGGENAGAPDFQEMRKKMEELNASVEKKLLAVLTEDQKSKMEKLKGPEFKFPENAGMFGFGGGGQGGQGRRQGGRPGGDGGA